MTDLSGMAEFPSPAYTSKQFSSYDRAAKSYELVFTKFKGAKAPDALFNAGLLRQALGQNDKAIAHYKEYAKQFNSEGQS